MIFHEGVPPTCVTHGVPDGMRTEAEEFWDTQRLLTTLREEQEQYSNENRLSILKWEYVRGCPMEDTKRHGNHRQGGIV
jgi:hypothetical protein